MMKRKFPDVKEEAVEGAAVRRSSGRGGVPPGLRAMAVAAFYFSLMSLAVKLAARLPTQEVVLARAVVTVVLSWIALRGAGAAPWGERRGLLLVRGVLGFAALSCFYYALAHLPLADATVIQYTNPVFTGLAAAWLLRERIGVREAACVLLSLTGVVLAVRPSFLFGAGSRLDPFAAGVGLLGAVLSAGAYVTVRKLGQTEHPLVIVFYFAWISVVGSLPAVLGELVLPTPGEWLALLAVGVTAQLGQVYLTRGLRLERAGRAISVGYLQIVFAALWGLLIFGEAPDAWGVAGAALIITSTLALSRTAAPATPGQAEARGR